VLLPLALEASSSDAVPLVDVRRLLLLLPLLPLLHRRR
jgi:hypothetical protein